MKTAVILSAGLATRLLPLTEHVTKCLVPVGGRPALWHQYNYYVQSAGADKVLVVVHSKHKQQVESVAELFQMDKLIVYCHDKSDGSANAVYSIQHAICGDNVILNWGDVIPVRGVVFTESSSNIVMLDDAINASYLYANGALLRCCQHGNVLGIYNLPNFMPIATPDYGKDFAALPYTYIGKHVFAADFGDLSKWQALNKLGLFGNASMQSKSIELNEQYVIKTCDNAFVQYNWYKRNPQPDMQVERVSHNQYKMSRIHGLSLSQCLHKRAEFKQQLLATFNKATVSFVTYKAGLHEEILNKFTVRALNSIAISDLVEIKQGYALALQLFKLLLSCFLEEQFCLGGHFDLNTSNVIVTPEGEFIKIDPRGYWALAVEGPLSYETSKLYHDLWYKIQTADELALIAMGNNHGIDVRQLIDANCLTGNEVLWLAVHALTCFGACKYNPIKEQCAFKLGMQLAKDILEAYHSDYSTK